MTSTLRYARTFLYFSIPTAAGAGACYTFYTQGVARRATLVASPPPPIPRRRPSFVAGNALDELRSRLTPPTVWRAIFWYVRLVWRTVRLAVGIFVLSAAAAMQRLRVIPEEALYAVMADLCAWLGPTYIKLGQWVASRPDAFPEKLCDAMATLFDRAPPHPWEKTMERLRGGNVLPALRSIDRTPVNVGSVAQVYRAVLHESTDGYPTGTPLAVKVLHPEVHEMVYVDVTALRIFARILQAVVPSLQFVDVRTGADEFAAFLISQLDLTREAENLVQFRQNFDGVKGVAFPGPLRSLCSPDVLVETFEEGRPLQSVTPSRTLAEIGVGMFFKMVFEDNFLHADLHPGNILVRYRRSNGAIAWDPQEGGEPELVLLDAGLTTSLRPSDRDNLIALLGATLSGDGELGAKLMLERSPCNRCRDPEGYVREMKKIFDVASPRTGTGAFALSSKDIAALLTEVMHTTRRYKVGIDGSFTSVVATVILGEGLVHRLHPEMNVFREAVPYLCRALSGHELAYVAKTLQESYGLKAAVSAVM